MSPVKFNAKAIDRRTPLAPSVVPVGRKVFTLSNGRVLSAEQWVAMKAIPPLKSADRRAADASQQTVAFGRRKASV